MDTLGKLFGSAARVKLLRLFLLNPDEVFESSETARRAKVMPQTARREIVVFSNMGLIKRRTGYKTIERKKKGSIAVSKKKFRGWTLDPQFQYIDALKLFFMHAHSLTKDEIARKLQRTGKIKLVVISGAFLQDWNSRVDILIVGNSMHKLKLAAAVKDMEAELGRELRYALFSAHDFRYRLGVYDKLVRDVLDFPHEVVVDRIGIS